MQIVNAVRRHAFPYAKHRQILNWLEDNIQENYKENQGIYTMSSVSQFIEWRSKDLKSWVLRIAGNPPVCYVEIENKEKEVVFLLVWQ